MNGQRRGESMAGRTADAQVSLMDFGYSIRVFGEKADRQGGVICGGTPAPYSLPMDHVTLPPELERFAAEAVAAGTLSGSVRTRRRRGEPAAAPGPGAGGAAGIGPRRQAGIRPGRLSHRRRGRRPRQGDDRTEDKRAGVGRVRNFSRRATADLDNGAAPAAAEQLLAAVLAAASRLARRPALGRRRPELLPEPFRFWSIPRGSCCWSTIPPPNLRLSCGC